MKFRHLLIAALLGGLVASALPAAAAQIGDALKLGETNIVDANTSLRGDAASNLVIRNTGNGVPLNLLTNGNGKAPMKVDSRRLVRNLNADQLDFRHANELIRAAFGSTGNAADGNGDAVTATITAPKPGLLIMGGSIDVEATSRDFHKCRLQVNGATVPGSRRSIAPSWAGGDHSANHEEVCSTDGGWAVDAGTHTVALNMINVDILPPVGPEFRNASVWVIWVPFDGNGDVPTP